MADLLFILIVCVFFGVAALLVHVCDHLIGPEESVVSATGKIVTEGEVAA